MEDRYQDRYPEEQADAPAREQQQEDPLYSDGFFPEETMDDPLFPDEEPQQPRKKKKKRTFRKIVRGIGRYIASLPTRTLLFLGGGMVLIILLIVLLVVLLSGRGSDAETPADPGQQLGLEDPVEPVSTPTLPPISTPTQFQPVSSDPTPTPGPVLKEGGIKRGDTDDLLPSIQERLVELGYMTIPEGGYTNKYGSVTKSAIQRFQLRNFGSYKDADGIIGPKTYDLLFSEDAKAFFLKSGDKDADLYDGKLVSDFQTQLKSLKYLSAVTGTYDEATKAAVTKFQSDHGLEADGVAGQSTFELVRAELDGTYAPPTPEPPSVTAEPAEITTEAAGG